MIPDEEPDPSDRWLAFETIDRGEITVVQHRRKRILGFAERTKCVRRAVRRRARRKR